MSELPNPPAELAFGGETYEPERDHIRLRGHLLATFNLMRDGQWRTLRTIANAVPCSEASASARLRDLRKPMYGGHIVERRHLCVGLYQYRLVLS